MASKRDNPVSLAAGSWKSLLSIKWALPAQVSISRPHLVTNITRFSGENQTSRLQD